LANAEREHPLTPLIAWQARVVCWLSGDCATRRFLSASTRLLAAYPNASCQGQVRGFQQAVMVWKRRSEQERIPNLLKEVSLHIQRLPPDTVRKGNFSARLRGRTFQEHCDLLLRRCSQLLAETQRQRWQIVPAALAALAAADGSATALPHRCFSRAVEKEDFALLLRTAQELADQIGERGYDALLAAVDQLPGSPDEIDFGQLRQLLARGNSLADSAWACEQRLLYSLVYSCLNIPAVRRLSEAFTQRGWPLSSDELTPLVGRIQSKKDLEPVHAWLAWLGSVSARALTPRMRKVLSATFYDRYLPSVQQHGWFEQLAPCLAAARRPKGPDDFRPLLDRIAVYQQLAGRKDALPKSLRKLLGVHERWQREREVLRARRAAGALDAAGQARLQHLENDPGASPDAAKIRRAAEEAFLLLGIESLSAVMRKLALATCRTHLGGLVALISPDHYWDFALWIDAMSEAERDRLREVIAAHDCHGRDYKRHLAENHDWLGQALVRGVDLGQWLAAEPDWVVIGGRTMEIALISDLRHVFLMGAYFQTCLSLGDCNEMSVLANAYDANKQVVFMFTDDDAGRRRVVARQLIAVSSEFKLLRYRCYVNSRCADKVNRQEVETAMALYCGRLAAQCCLELADQGSPEAIGDHFWYDDGERGWPAAARAAWAERSRAMGEMALASC